MTEDLTTDKHLDGAKDPDAVTVREGREETAPEAVDQTGRFRERREGRAQFGEEHEEED
jgi:hypothetical protein